MTIIDFMVKHPIVTFLIISDFFATVENLVSYLIYGGKRARSKRFNERVYDSLNEGGEKVRDIIRDAERKNEKVEIGFHSNK